MAETVLREQLLPNAYTHVRVIHVSMTVNEVREASARGDRILVFLTDSDHHRIAADTEATEKMSRKRLEAVWRDASVHAVVNNDEPQELLMIEFLTSDPLAGVGDPVETAEGEPV